MIDISTKFAGLELQSPIIVGSSGLTNSIKHLKEYAENGAGAVVLKSIFEEEILFEHNKLLEQAEQFGYDQENADYFDLKIKQDNINKYIKLIKKAKEEINIPVIASINCISTYEWTYFTKKIEDAGADALELNMFFLPNDSKKNSIEIEEKYFKIIEKVRANTKLPLIIKMSHFFTNLGEMIQKIGDKADGIVLFNKFTKPDIDLRTQTITMNNVFSSKEDFSLPLRWVGISSGKTNCSVAGSTGIHSGQELAKIILAGADAAQVVSTIYKNGADQIKKMNNFLIDYLKERDLESIMQIKGLLNRKNIADQNLYERLQFMKYFSDKE